MESVIEKLREEIEKESFVRDIDCFIIFGSYVYFGKNPNDIDICVVVKDRNANLESLSNYICSKFENPDLTIYFRDELESGLPFTDIGNGIFAIEYLSYGIPLYGENLFKNLLLKIDRNKYKESLLQKAFEYVLRLRVVYYSDKDVEYKKKYFCKYVIRLAKTTLLFLGSNYSELMTLHDEEVVRLLVQSGVARTITLGDLNSLDYLFELFEELNLLLLTFNTRVH